MRDLKRRNWSAAVVCRAGCSRQDGMESLKWSSAGGCADFRAPRFSIGKKSRKDFSAEIDDRYRGLLKPAIQRQAGTESLPAIPGGKAFEVPGPAADCSALRQVAEHLPEDEVLMPVAIPGGCDMIGPAGTASPGAVFSVTSGRGGGAESPVSRIIVTRCADCMARLEVFRW